MGALCHYFWEHLSPFFPTNFFIHYHSQTFTFCEHKNPHVLKITNHKIEDKSRGTNLAKTITYITTHTIYSFFFFLFFYLFLYVYIYIAYTYIATIHNILKKETLLKLIKAVKHLPKF